MQQVTTKKFAEMCGVSDANIRALIGKGKLKAEKDILTGGHLLDVDLPENREYLNNRKGLTQQLAKDNHEYTQPNTQANNDIIAMLTQRIEELAKEAGKTELLTDNIIQIKDDVKHWQDKYFELQHNYEILRNENELFKQTNKNNQDLLEKISHLESRNSAFEETISKIQADAQSEINRVKNDYQLEINSLKDQVKKLEQLKAENLQLKEQLNKKAGFLGLFKK